MVDGDLMFTVVYPFLLIQFTVLYVDIGSII